MFAPSSCLTIKSVDFKNKKPIDTRHKQFLLKKGARDVVVISASSIVVSEWVLMKCKFGCDGYNQCLTCPPHSPSPEQTKRILASYSRALLVHFVNEKKGRQRKWPSLRKIMGDAERALFLDGFERAWALAAGPCDLCAECTMDVCAHPEYARPSMEACGIDVFSTAHAAGLPLRVVTSREQPIDLYCLLLID